MPDEKPESADASSPVRPVGLNQNHPLPLAVVFDKTIVDQVIAGCADACATLASLNSSWEEDDSATAKVLTGLEAINPVSGLYNLYMHGQWTSEIGGAQAVKINGAKRQILLRSFTNDFTKKFSAEAAKSPSAAIQYLRLLVQRARYAIRAVNEQFKLAHKVNGDICEAMNDAIDRSYRISTTAAVAFMIVGCLPIAAGGTATMITANATTGTILASSGTAGMVTVKVAGAGLIYGYLNTVAFDPATATRARYSGVSLEAGAKAGGVNAGGTTVQYGLTKGAEALLESKERQINREANRARVRNYVDAAARDARAAKRPPISTKGIDRIQTPKFPRGGLTEPQIDMIEKRRNDIKREVAKNKTWAGRGVSGLFIAYGLYNMRHEIATAYQGLTQQPGVDRRR